LLKEHTFLGDTQRLAKRVFYTLTDGRDNKSSKEKATIYKIGVCLGMLMENLNNSGVLSDEDINDILLAVAIGAGDIPEDDI
jgi:hypothetical protein